MELTVLKETPKGVIVKKSKVAGFLPITAGTPITTACTDSYDVTTLVSELPAQPGILIGNSEIIAVFANTLCKARKNGSICYFYLKK